MSAIRWSFSSFHTSIQRPLRQHVCSISGEGSGTVWRCRRKPQQRSYLLVASRSASWRNVYNSTEKSSKSNVVDTITRTRITRQYSRDSSKTAHSDHLPTSPSPPSSPSSPSSLPSLPSSPSSPPYPEDIPLKSSSPPARSPTSSKSVSQSENERSVPISGPSSAGTTQIFLAPSSGYAKYIDDILGHMYRLGHTLNVYTGTDYSGITALRSLIANQERVVAGAYGAVTSAKESHNAALASQSSRQKEVVQLLERKNSWSAGDLERYMSLIRREHVEEQAVAEAGEALAAAERDLEAARVELEKIERRQYHEEQVWSDTIRRNSTWVTIGLMGFNVVLLLFSVIVFEPWRRRRIVREVKEAFVEAESKHLQLYPSVSPAATALAPSAASSAPTETLVADNANEPLLATTAPEADSSATTTLHGAAATIPPTADDTSVERALIEGEIDAMTPPENVSLETLERQDESATLTKRFQQIMMRLFSDDKVVISQRDFTMTVIQAASTSAVGMGVLFIVWLGFNS